MVKSASWKRKPTVPNWLILASLGLLAVLVLLPIAPHLQLIPQSDSSVFLYSGQRILDGEQEARLIALACSAPPNGRARWTLQLLADKLVALEVVGQDRPGIVREITRALSAQGINVEELATECVSAPMSGETLFQAKARILVPAQVPLDEVRRTLENGLPGLTVELERVK